MTNATTESFGYRLRTLRKQAGLTQKELASHLSVSAQIVSNWERNYTTGITPQRIARIAAVLHTTVGQLMGDMKETDELPPEAMEELENFKEYLRYKYTHK